MVMKDDDKFSLSWFFRWFLNNQGVTVLLVMLLVFLNIWVFTHISSLLTPIFSFLAVISLPLVISALVYYLLKPAVDWLESKGLGRLWAILIVFLGLILFLIWAIAALVPMIETQLTAFVTNLPNYITDVENQVTLILKDDRLAQFRPQLESFVTDFSGKALELAQTFSKNAVDWAGNFAGTVARVTVAIIISPFIIFYLLRDGSTMKDGFVKFLPTPMRETTARILHNVNAQLSGYVQGQVTVAIVVGIMFSILFTIIGLPYAVTFGITAGFLNMIPYLGSFLAMVPVVILALVDGPLMLVKVAVVFTIEQTIEGRFVTPLVLGSKLNIHPITIMFILLISGSAFGVWGVFLGIPVYAAAKVVLAELFNWYKDASGLYEEIAEQTESEGENHVK
ncbi:AI-2E family transporter [Streptococcus porci]|uniref:AI-2E family transporter n=1 Tax=Streptococcus porci TaxID=502567 RepID=UPI00048A2D2D|nr:AI-2E family transporter [Streptococcus porci]